MKKSLDMLIAEGFNIIFKYQKYEHIKNKVINEYSSILKNRIDKFNIQLQIKILENLLDKNKNVFDDDYWQEYAEKNIKKINIFDDLFTDIESCFLIVLYKVKSVRTQVNWHKVLDDLSEIVIKTKFNFSGFIEVIKILAEKDKSIFKDIVYKTRSKRYPAKLRYLLYREVIKLGMLDKKIARRIRGETNGEVSVRLLNYFFENRNIYKEEEFDDLVLQFFDTRNKYTARYIALNVPMHLISFLLSIKDKEAQSIVKKRLYFAE